MYPTRHWSFCNGRNIITTIRKSACVPVNTGISMGTRTEYGLLRRTPEKTVGNNYLNYFVHPVFKITSNRFNDDVKKYDRGAILLYYHYYYFFFLPVF